MSQEHKLVDPENRMGTDWHAARALGRRREDDPNVLEFESIADLAARREAVTKAHFRNKGAHEGEAQRMRAAMLKVLDKLEGRRTPEQLALLKLLEGQAEHAAFVWTEKYPVEGAPKKEKIIAAAKSWLASLPNETLNGLIKLCPETAQLVVVPPLVVPDQLGLIDGNKTISGQTDSKIWWPEGWNAVRAPKWGFGITDSREDMPFDPTIYWKNPDAPEEERVARTNEEMVAEYARRFEANGLKFMPQHGYVPSAANALARGRVLDRRFYTAFKRPPGAALLPLGDWSNDHVYLGRNDPGGSYEVLRGRPWVEGEMAV